MLNLKRSLALVAALTLVAAVVTGCGGYGRKRTDDAAAGSGTAAGQTDGSGSGSPAPAAEPKQIGPLAVGESGELNGITWTLVSVMSVPSTLGETHQFVQVELQIDHRGQKQISVNSMLNFRLTAPSGETLAPNLQAMGSVGSQRIDATVQPGDSHSGLVAFNAPIEDGDWKFEIDPQDDSGTITWVFEVPPISE